MPRTIVVTIAVVIAASLLGCGKPAPKPEAQAGRQTVQAGLWITDPPDGAAVMQRPYMAGTVSDTTVQAVWLVVRAVGTTGYWVQPPVPVRPDGMWVAQPYIGLPETATGVRFEVKAFADPAAELASGTELKAWPEARWASNLVTVSRQ
jgi:hypothetical protein